MPGQASGGSFQKEKNYIAQKEFAYRMCARRPTSAMPKSFLCCERAFCCSMVVMSCAFTPDTFYTKHLSDQAPFSPGTCYTRQLLHQPHFTPGTFYARKLLHQTPFTPGTFYTRHLLRQTPFTPNTFQTRHLLHQTLVSSGTRRFGDLYLGNDFVLKNTTFRAPAIPQNVTTRCACREKSHTVLHQILRLPRQMNLMINPHHIWNVIYNARSNSQHPRTSPNTAPATQNDHPTSDRNLLKTGQTSFPMRDRSENDPRPIWPGNRKPQPGAPQRLLFTFARSRFYWKLQRFPAPAIIPHFTKCCACHEKWHMNFTKCCTCHEK